MEKIKSLAGEPCIIRPNIDEKLQVNSHVEWKDLENGNYSFQLKKGEEVILYKNENDLSLKVNAVKQEGKTNYLGSLKQATK